MFGFVFPALAVLSLCLPLCCIGEQVVLFLRAEKRGRGRTETGLSKNSQCSSFATIALFAVPGCIPTA